MGNHSILLRAFELEDYILINKWRNDPEIQKLITGPFRYVSTEMEKGWVHEKMMNNTSHIYLAICVNDESKKMIGYTSFNNINHLNRVASIGGVVIGDKNYRNGIAYIDAVCILFDYGFNELNLNRLEGSAFVLHKTSVQMLLSMGFKVEGYCRQAVYKHGRYEDVLILAILKEEYDIINNADGYTFEKVAERLTNNTKTK
jgi:RimJ/RimL family protein N-acetyltransferase